MKRRGQEVRERGMDGLVLIPAFPEEISMEILKRVPFTCLMNLFLVSKAWKKLLSSIQFFNSRIKARYARPHLVVLTTYANAPIKNQLSMYDTESNTWFKGPSIPLSSSQTRAAGVECQLFGSFLLLCGGWRDRPLRSFTVFDFILNKWIACRQMQIPRAHFASAVIGREMYVVGGNDGCSSRCSSGEVFDFDSNTWSFLPRALEPISFCLSLPVDGKLYIRARGGNPSETFVLSPGSTPAWSIDSSDLFKDWNPAASYVVTRRMHDREEDEDEEDEDEDEDEEEAEDEEKDVVYQMDNLGLQYMAIFDMKGNEWEIMDTTEMQELEEVEEPGILNEFQCLASSRRVDGALWAISSRLSVASIDVSGGADGYEPQVAILDLHRHEYAPRKIIAAHVVFL